jgi:hypothetical protein
MAAELQPRSKVWSPLSSLWTGTSISHAIAAEEALLRRCECCASSKDQTSIASSPSPAGPWTTGNTPTRGQHEARPASSVDGLGSLTLWAGIRIFVFSCNSSIRGRGVSYLKEVSIAQLEGLCGTK